jgi:hypothetical protein
LEEPRSKKLHWISLASQVWTDAPRGFVVHDAEFSASVASPEEAARAAEERQQEQQEAVMQEEVGVVGPTSRWHA